jgi:hypothetical protein
MLLFLIFSRILGRIFSTVPRIVNIVSTMSNDRGIILRILHFQMQYWKISKINSKSVHSVSIVLLYQKIFFRFGSFPCILSLDKWMNPFNAVLVTGQSKKRCLKDSF